MVGTGTTVETQDHHLRHFHLNSLFHLDNKHINCRSYTPPSYILQVCNNKWPAYHSTPTTVQIRVLSPQALVWHFQAPHSPWATHNRLMATPIFTLQDMANQASPLLHILFPAHIPHPLLPIKAVCPESTSKINSTASVFPQATTISFPPLTASCMSL